jgi:hypothetical protein
MAVALERAPYELGVKTDITVSFMEEIVQENPLASRKCRDTVTLMLFLAAISPITTARVPNLGQTCE